MSAMSLWQIIWVTVRHIPGKRQRKGQRNERQEIRLPARVEGVVGENVFEYIAKG